MYLPLVQLFTFRRVTLVSLWQFLVEIIRHRKSSLYIRDITGMFNLRQKRRKVRHSGCRQYLIEQKNNNKGCDQAAKIRMLVLAFAICICVKPHFAITMYLIFYLFRLYVWKSSLCLTLTIIKILSDESLIGKC